MRFVRANPSFQHVLEDCADSLDEPIYMFHRINEEALRRLEAGTTAGLEEYGAFVSERSRRSGEFSELFGVALVDDLVSLTPERRRQIIALFDSDFRRPLLEAVKRLETRT